MLCPRGQVSVSAFCLLNKGPLQITVIFYSLQNYTLHAPLEWVGKYVLFGVIALEMDI